MTERDNLALQVIRPADGPHSALGQFTLLDFDIAQPIAFVEQIDGAIYAQDRDEVNAYRMVADNLSRVALSADKSRRLITGLIAADPWK